MRASPVSWDVSAVAVGCGCWVADGFTEAAVAMLLAALVALAVVLAVALFARVRVAFGFPVSPVDEPAAFLAPRLGAALGSSAVTAT